MKSIEQIYSDYQIMPNLQMHQLRVAAVGKMISDSFPSPLNTNDIVVALLLHDMGNIIKFDLNYFPEFLKPQGPAYWRKVKDEFIKKYGPKEHRAALAIAREISISEKAFLYLDSVGFSNLDKTFENPSFEKKICSYADMRVGPYGVLSIEERLSEGRERYAGRKNAQSANRLEALAEALRGIERQIFSKANIKPGNITDQSIKETIGQIARIRFK